MHAQCQPTAQPFSQAVKEPDSRGRIIFAKLSLNADPKPCGVFRSSQKWEGARANGKADAVWAFGRSRCRGILQHSRRTGENQSRRDPMKPSPAAAHKH